MPGWPYGLSIDLAAQFAGVSESTFRRLVMDAKAPPPRRISDGRLIWLLPELETWMQSLPIDGLEA
jgi:predicted DNA-binding transcriptional regulator AlpA